MSAATVLNQSQLSLIQAENNHKATQRALSQSIKEDRLALQALTQLGNSAHQMVMSSIKLSIQDANNDYKRAFKNLCEPMHDSVSLAKQLYNSALSIANAVLEKKQPLSDAHHAFIGAFLTGLEDICSLDDVTPSTHPMDLDDSAPTPRTQRHSPVFFRDACFSSLSDSFTETERYTPINGRYS